ncbi:MAG: ATP-binding protein [Verrucomicrobia bacterium]|nr:ATP-binding protein [Verrucomicrobiota bacterium]MBU1858315.1 ATP-binding protein [Verrucomicrobiota bacterium]
MNKKDIFKEIIRSFHMKPLAAVKKRPLELPFNSGKLITVSGVRRSGKTFLLLDAISRLLAQGVEISRIVYVNFEDERLDADKKDLDLILQAYQELYPEAELSKTYFFFDEIQNVDGWEKFIRRVYDTVSKNIFVTGSNSKLLSTDIATSLRGRNLGYEIYPLSFAECLSFGGINTDIHDSRNRAKIASNAGQYLLDGGFPELFFIAQDFRIKTLQGYFNVMLFKDLMERYKRKPHAHLLKYFIKRLLANISSPLSLHKIYNELRSQGYKIDKNLLYELMEELNSIYFFFPLRKYSASVIKRETSEKKFYAVDNGLAGAISFSIGEDRGKLLENAVFMQFHSTGSDIFFYKDKKECDFIHLATGGKPEAYQVAYDLASADTKKREFDGLIEACQRLGLTSGTIITMSEEFEEKTGGVKIQVVPFYKWALSCCPGGISQ